MLIVKFACACLILIACIACSYEPLHVTGEVVDETGTPLSGVDVKACYSGWGFSKGNVVWDKDYCSETTQTDNEGLYVIAFRGPVSARLMASKEGWIQNKDYNTTQPRIVLTRSEDYALRQKAEAGQLEIDNRKPLSDESQTDYYCRVILPGVRPVRLNYQDEIITITPVLLEDNNQSKAVFALQGSTRVADFFMDEMVIKINGEIIRSNVSTASVENSCGTDTHFICLTVSGPHLSPDTRIEFLIPGIRAMFDVKIWEI